MNNSAKSTLAGFVRNINVLKDTVVSAAQQHADHTMSRDDGRQLTSNHGKVLFLPPSASSLYTQLSNLPLSHTLPSKH